MTPNYISGSYQNVQYQQYLYDGLLRLKDYDQGAWSGSAITSSNKQRWWKLDQLGNWAQTYSDLSQTTSEQTRTHNAANELTAIDCSTGNGLAIPAEFQSNRELNMHSLQ